MVKMVFIFGCETSCFNYIFDHYRQRIFLLISLLVCLFVFTFPFKNSSTPKLLQGKSYNTPVKQKFFCKRLKPFQSNKKWCVEITIFFIFYFFVKPKSGQIFIFLYCSFRSKVKIRTKSCNKKIDKLWLKQLYLTITLRTYKANKCEKSCWILFWKVFTLYIKASRKLR